MIQTWSACHLHTGDGECLEWAQRMADKWLTVQHTRTGLMPNHFGALPGGHVGVPQPPGRWVEVRNDVLTAARLLQASEMLQASGSRRAAGLADQLKQMGTRLAIGLAHFGYDAERRVFREHLRLDGSPYESTARYCFRTEAERDEAVKSDPGLAQVAVYDGAGFYRNPNYFEFFAGSSVPYHLAVAASLAREPDLTGCVERCATDALDEFRRLDGAFTGDGRWTFRATGWYILTHLTLHRMSDGIGHLQAAREMAQGEIARLHGVRAPQWWRTRERHVLLDALLQLNAARDRADA